MNYQEAKEELKKRVSSIRYFSKRTYDTIVKERKQAEKIAEAGGDVQAFYRASETARTKFYKENSGAYCELLSLLC